MVYELPHAAFAALVPPAVAAAFAVDWVFLLLPIRQFAVEETEF